MSGGCYFPLEVQGEFMTQSLASREISYSTVSVLYNSIPGWGSCHSRHSDHRVVLREDGREGSSSCFRCLRMSSRSKNVIQLHMREIYECHRTEEESLRLCPTSEDVTSRSSTEMMLYKTRGFYGESAVSKVHCPINGRYQFTYSNSETVLQQPACPTLTSQAGDCPTGYKFDLQFRGCNFPDLDMSFQCLGHWAGEDGQNYLSLLDTKLPQLGEEPRPRYRCAIYRTDSITGVTHLSLSSDSTCVNQLDSAHSGFESLQLQTITEGETLDREEMPLPSWSQGHWDSVTVSGSEITYRDEVEMTTYNLQSLSSPRDGHYLIRQKSSCGNSSYSCLHIERRTDNIMELRLSRDTSETPGHSLCSEASLAGSRWITQGRGMYPTSCPLEGEFTGKLPDAEGLCTRSVTSCERPDQMRYTVYNCENQSEIYEDRHYQCYGQFHEKGLVYTFTKRIDLPGHECFVGWTEDNVSHIVTEAGTHCERGKEPLTYGMLLVKQAGRERCETRTVSPRLASVLRTTTTSTTTSSTTVTTTTTDTTTTTTTEYNDNTREYNNANLTNNNYCLMLTVISLLLLLTL